MKKHMIRVALGAMALVLAASLSFAAELKVNVPDVNGQLDAAKAKADAGKASAKGKADAAKADAKGKVDATKADAKGKVDAAKGKADAAKAVAKGKLVDLNTATDAELKAIPGIGDAYAAKIIVGRPYANKAQLKSRKILPDAVYESVKELIIAKQPEKKK